MKIMMISINYWPEVVGIGAFTTYRAEYLASVGHEVDVYTTFPYYPEWKVSSMYTRKIFEHEEHKGVSIYRSCAYVPNVPSPLKRIIHEGSFVATSLVHALMHKRPDLLYVVSPPLGLAASAILLSNLWKIPYTFDVEDLQPDSAAEHNMLPKSALKILYRVEAAAYHRASLVTTLTSGMRSRILSKGISEEKIVLIEPRMDECLTKISDEEGRRFREKYDIGNKFLAVYSGNIGVKQGLDVVVDAAFINRHDRSIQFLVVGDGADRRRVQQRAKEMNLKNLRFLPLLDETDFRGLLSASGVCLVVQRMAVSEIAFPSKVVTYLAAGCAVIASVSGNSEIAQTVRESDAGEVVDAENPEALLKALLAVKEAGREQYSHNARAYAQKRWSGARVLGNLERSLQSVITKQIRG